MPLFGRRDATRTSTGTGAKGRGAKSGLLALCWFIAFAGWACATAGLFALGSSCFNARDRAQEIQRLRPATNAVALNREAQALLSVGLGVVPYQGCVQVFQFQWFHIAFELFCLAAGLTMLIPRMRGSRMAVIGLFAIATVFFMMDCNIFLGLKTRLRQAPGQSTAYTRSLVVFSGFLIASAGNLLVIMALGAKRRDEDRIAGDGHYDDVAVAEHNKHAGVRSVV